MVGECQANVSSPGKMVGECRANVSSPANFPKWPFWRVLEFDKFAGEWPLLTNKAPNLSRLVKHKHFLNCIASLSVSRQLNQSVIVNDDLHILNPYFYFFIIVYLGYELPKL